MSPSRHQGLCISDMERNNALFCTISQTLVIRLKWHTTKESHEWTASTGDWRCGIVTVREHIKVYFSQCEKRQLQSRLALLTHMQTFHDSGTYFESCVWFRPPWEWNTFIMYLFIGICHCGDRNARNTQLPMSTKTHTGNRMTIDAQITNLQAWKASNPEETLSNVL